MTIPANHSHCEKTLKVCFTNCSVYHLAITGELRTRRALEMFTEQETTVKHTWTFLSIFQYVRKLI